MNTKKYVLLEMEPCKEKDATSISRLLYDIAKATDTLDGLMKPDKCVCHVENSCWNVNCGECIPYKLFSNLRIPIKWKVIKMEENTKNDLIPKSKKDLLFEVLSWLIECKCLMERVCEREWKKKKLERIIEEYTSFVKNRLMKD